MRTGISKWHLVLAPVACAFMFGTAPAAAQEYGPSGDSYNNPPEQVEITRPRLHFRVGHFGQLEKVSTSRELQMSDSALRTRDGARELRAQVRVAASDACSDLKYHFPYTVDSWHTCYHDAVATGMRHATWAIERARYEP